MTILYDATATVKPAKPFGKGILATGPVYRDDVSQADRIEAAFLLNADCTDFQVVSDADLDQAAGCALAQARLDAGFSGWF